MRKNRWAVAGVFLFGLIVVVALLFGGNAGEMEWSPDTFRCRGSSYYVIFPDIRVTPKFRHDMEETDLEKWLKAKGYLKTSVERERWYFVHGHMPGSRGMQGCAKELRNAFGDPKGTSDRWVRWSERHPEIAADLWPTIIEQVRRDSDYCDAAADLLDSMTDRITGEIDETITMEEYLEKKKIFEDKCRDWDSEFWGQSN